MARGTPLKPIRFDPSGVSRGFNIPVTVAYDLENCYIDRNGKVTRLNTPSTYTPAGGAEFQQGKPYFEWNGELIDAVQSDSGGTASDITGPLGTSFFTEFEIFSGDSFAQNLYVSGLASINAGSDGYFTYMLQPDYDHDTDENDNISVEPALIHNVTSYSWTLNTYEQQSGITAGQPTNLNVTDGLYTFYLFIPYNKRGEAGPWYFASNRTLRGVVTLNDGATDYYHTSFVDLFIDCNEEVDHIDIYSTMTVNSSGEASIEGLNSVGGLSIDQEILTWDSGAFTWWFREKVKPTEVTLSQTRYLLRWTDTEHLMPAPLFESLLLAKTTGIVGAAGLDYFIEQDVKDNFAIEPRFRVPQTPLTEERNMWRTAPPSTDWRLGFGDGVDDQFQKDAGGAGTHHLVIEGDYTSSISANDYIRIHDEEVSGWDGVYGVDSISFSGGTNKTTIVSSNFTSSPAATVNPVPATVFWTYFTGGPDLERIEGVAARTMFNHNGVMLYGNVTMGKPDVRQNIAHVTAGGAGAGDKYGAMFEYLDENNEIGTGPFLAPIYSPSGEFDLSDGGRMAVPWNGELALQIWKYDGSGDDSIISNYTLLDRVTPSSDGWYHTSLTGTDGVKSKWAYWLDNPDRITQTPVTYKTPAAGYYTLPNVAVMSDVNRPIQTTYNKFMVPRNESIRAIVPTRLEEAEGVASYDFVVLTDKAVHIYKRDGFSVTKIQTVLNDAGVQLINPGDIGLNNTGQTPDTQHPLVAPFEGGIAFVSTDDRVYVLSGRQLAALDEDQRGLFGTTWNDIAYHEKENEIWVAHNDNEIWIYDLELGGWNKNYTLSTDWQIECLFYSEVNQQMLAYVDTDAVSSPNTTWDTYIFDDGGAALTSGIATQEFDQSGRIMRIARLSVDYDRSDYTASNRAKVLHYVDAKTDNQTADVLDVLESNAQNRIEYTVPRVKSVYPTLVGRRHQLKISEFESLESVLVAPQEEDEFN